MAEKKPEAPAEKIAIGQVAVGDYEPTAEDLARLARNKVNDPPPPPPVPEAPIKDRLALVAPSTATRTMAEMERGAAIVRAKQEERNRRIEASGQ